jgi:hypothetical protein
MTSKLNFNKRQCDEGVNFFKQKRSEICKRNDVWLLEHYGVSLRRGRVIAQAVNRWLPTAAGRVRSRVWSSEICGGQSGAGSGFLQVLRFPLPIFIPPNSPLS